jgi:hypothetical protein
MGMKMGSIPARGLDTSRRPWSIRVKDSALRAQYHRLKPRLGRAKAIVAVAHSLLVSLYHTLKRKAQYQDLGPDSYDQNAQEAIRKSCVRRLERLGDRVTLEAAPPTTEALSA